MPQSQSSSPWVLDRRIPLALVLGLLIQFGTGVWVAAQMRLQIDILDRRMTTFEVKVEPVGDRMTRMETLLETMVTEMRRTNNRLERAEDDLRRRPHPPQHP